MFCFLYFILLAEEDCWHNLYYVVWRSIEEGEISNLCLWQFRKFALRGCEKKIVLGCRYVVHFVVLFGITMYICVQYIFLQSIIWIYTKWRIYQLNVYNIKTQQQCYWFFSIIVVKILKQRMIVIILIVGPRRSML
jgi:hypothetical protein